MFNKNPILEAVSKIKKEDIFSKETDHSPKVVKPKFNASNTSSEDKKNPEKTGAILWPT